MLSFGRLLLFLSLKIVFSQSEEVAGCDKYLPKLTRYLHRQVPELSFLGAYLDSVSHGDTHLMMKIDACPDRNASDSISRFYYEVYVGEDHPDHTTRIYTFLVRKDFRNCLLWDIAEDTPPVPIARARKTRKWKHEWAERRKDPRYRPR
jgi:hypothetical protein